MNSVIDSMLLPIATERIFYRPQGYYFSKNIFTEAELEAALVGCEHYYAGLGRQ